MFLENQKFVILMSVLVLQELYNYRSHVALSTSMALNNSDYILLFPKDVTLYEEFCSVVCKSSLMYTLLFVSTITMKLIS